MSLQVSTGSLLDNELDTLRARVMRLEVIEPRLASNVAYKQIEERVLALESKLPPGDLVWVTRVEEKEFRDEIARLKSRSFKANERIDVLERMCPVSLDMDAIDRRIESLAKRLVDLEKESPSCEKDTRPMTNADAIERLWQMPLRIAQTPINEEGTIEVTYGKAALEWIAITGRRDPKRACQDLHYALWPLVGDTWPGPPDWTTENAL